MPGIEVIREDVETRVILRLQGKFDGPAAYLLNSLLTDIEPTQQVVVDFSRVIEFQDLAVGVLTRGLTDRSCQLQGLRSHQERMFQYFGVATHGHERTVRPPKPSLRVA
ncbi:MAG: STAS domain-containing protein [Myxococcaceae bacterium]